MQALSTLLRKLGNVSVVLNAMQNRAVAGCLASKVKVAANFGNTDYQDIADTCTDYLADHAADFCPEDIIRLQTLAVMLEDINKVLHTVQDTVLSAQC